MPHAPRSPRPADEAPAPPENAAENAAVTAARAARKRAKAERAKGRTAYNAGREAGVDRLALHRALTDLVRADETSPPPRGGPRRAQSGTAGKWVPIGPSVIRRGQAMDRPLVSGRIRDLAVHDDGRRAYAASAKGGVWYTEDAGATWAPVGAWPGERRVTGGNTSVFACSALLVEFGATQADDVVLAGTGEHPISWNQHGAGSFGGVGVLAAIGPVVGDAGAGRSWEWDAGVADLESAGIFRLVRHPRRHANAGSSDPAARDEVLAATTDGLFRGVRTALPAAAAAGHVPGLPARDGYVWTRLAGAPAGVVVTDVLWIERGAGERIVIFVSGDGVEVSDDDGATFDPVPTMHWPAVAVAGRGSLAIAEAGRAYVLFERGGRPAVARIADLTVATPVATRLTGVPQVWDSPTTREYDQAIAAEAFDGRDRVYLGGNTVMPRPNTQWCASLWAYDVVGTALRPRVGVSDRAQAGADRLGLIGNNVHADVHIIRLPGPSAATRPVWVGCDGGVFVSPETGRVQTFAPMNTGLSVLETGYLDVHPESSHFAATGMQDNGTAVRTGDTVWEAIHVGDGGGVAFVPTDPSIIVAQYVGGFWRSESGTFRDPLTRGVRRPTGAIDNHPEYTTRAEWYSGVATIVDDSGSQPRTRFALGTDRVYLCDNLGTGTASRWAVLGVTPVGAAANATLAQRDPFPMASAADQNFGRLGMGRVAALTWLSSTELIVACVNGVMRLTELLPQRWHAERLTTAGALSPGTQLDLSITDVAEVPGTRDFYVTTSGSTAVPTADTCYFFEAATATFHRTGLREALDSAPGVNGPIDPAYSVVVDPENPTVVFVGTACGVFRAARAGTPPVHSPWAPFVNGLPDALVQDLVIQRPPGGGASPRLLRAAVQSRGIWETDLAAPTPDLTYVRAHPFDDRRRSVPALAVSPRDGALLFHTASPDIVVRPSWPAAAAPAFPVRDPRRPTAPLTRRDSGFHTWTFQTAFRWWYPSVRATGEWTEAFSDLITRDRRVRGMPAGTTITPALWDAVVGGTRVRSPAPGRLERSADPADPLAVFRPPWHTAACADLPASEVDLMECVVPPSEILSTWVVTPQPSVVEVLLHRRGAAMAGDGAHVAGLLWRPLARGDSALSEPSQAFVDWWTGVVAGGGAVPAPPAGWSFVPGAGPRQTHQVAGQLEARLPKAVPIPLDLSGQRTSLMLLAFVATVGVGLAPVVGAPTTLLALADSWPHIAARRILVTPNPV